ncbi:MAG: UDP-glucose:undecaprenyl-phosphate glucose-1-phosphate transferase [Chlamydiae bacterium]|nr:UDP-glucose:undecaprenyl-phosphate glucose-1-phosphate transferase [Chlamydiota bacterium]
METVNQAGVAAQTLRLPKATSFKVRHFPVKRTFDIVFSFITLLLLSPIYLMIMIAIKINSRGKAIYAHRRVGRGGKAFNCYKFRTMYQDADKRLEKILAKDPALCVEWETKHKLTKDPRITPIGKILRKTSLDELPQFWNVLVGSLSVVGPRPVVQEEINKYFGVKAYKILSIRPGITGIWQVSGRNDTSYETRIKLDEKYVDKHSFVFDVKLILKTIPKMISSKGAY